MNFRASFVGKSPMNVAILVAAGLLLATGARSDAQTSPAAPTAASGGCAGDNGGITLSPDFCATVFANKLGPRPAHGGGGERGRLRQYLERSLLL
jgi:hypothetical protein